MNVHGIGLKHLSYSSISLFQRCRREWLLRYKYNISSPLTDALPFGTAIHRAIQGGLVSGGIDDATAENFPATLRQAFAEAKFKSGDAAFNQLSAMGQAMLADKTTQVILNGIKVSGGENIERPVSFTVPGVPIPVIGYIDIIDDDGQLYDIKTSKYGWTDEQAIDELQPDFYLVAMDDAGDTRHAGMFNHVILIKSIDAPAGYIITTARALNYRERVYTIVQNTWNAIEAGDFQQSDNSPCNSCSMRNICGKI